MTCISTIDYQTRLDVNELLAQYSHLLDHDRGACWADLFTTDGVFECADGKRLAGPAELATVPGLVHAKGNGAWRHIITAIVIERGDKRKGLTVRAYGPVLDMDQGGTVAAFFDYEFTLRFAARWRIAHVMATRVGNASMPTVGVAAFAGAGTSLQ
ncbi:MAG: nuclear transport factor 2 family protein [Sphingomonas sp.]